MSEVSSEQPENLGSDSTFVPSPSRRSEATDMKAIPFNAPHIGGRELHFIQEAVERYRCLSGNGEFTRRCQNWLGQSVGADRALLTHSCTAALEMSGLLSDLQPGEAIAMRVIEGRRGRMAAEVLAWEAALEARDG